MSNIEKLNAERRAQDFTTRYNDLRHEVITEVEQAIRTNADIISNQFHQLKEEFMDEEGNTVHGVGIDEDGMICICYGETPDEANYGSQSLAICDAIEILKQLSIL